MARAPKPDKPLTQKEKNKRRAGFYTQITKQLYEIVKLMHFFPPNGEYIRYAFNGDFKSLIDLKKTCQSLIFLIDWMKEELGGDMAKVKTKPRIKNKRYDR